MDVGNFPFTWTLLGGLRRKLMLYGCRHEYNSVTYCYKSSPKLVERLVELKCALQELLLSPNKSLVLHDLVLRLKARTSGASNRINILGLFFPTFQQNDQKLCLKTNVSMLKCSAIGDISKHMENSTEEIAQNVESQEIQAGIGTWQKFPEDQTQVFRHSLDHVNRSAGLFSNSLNVNGPIKTALKKKKKKGKLCNRCSGNDNAPGTLDLATSTSPFFQNSSNDVVSMSQLTKCSQFNEMVCCQSSEVSKENSICNEVSSKCGSICSPCVPNSEGLESLVNSDNTESISSINEESSEVVLQDSALYYEKIGKASHMKKAGKLGKDTETNSGSAVNSSITSCEEMGICLKDARDFRTKSFSKSSCHGNSLIRGHILPRKSDNQKIDSCGNRSSETMCQAWRSNTLQNKLIVNSNSYMIEQNAEALSSRSQSIGCIEHSKSNSRMWISAEDSDNKAKGAGTNGATDEGKCTGLSSTVSYVRSEYDGRQFRTSNNNSLVPNYLHSHKHIGKENSHFIWWKTGKTIGHTQIHGRKSGNDHLWKNACPPGYFYFVESNNIESSGELHQQSIYVNRCVLRQRRKSPWTGDRESHRTGRRVLANPHAWTFQQSLSNRLHRYVPRVDDGRNRAWVKPRYQLNQPFNQHNDVHFRRRFWVSKANMYRPQSRLSYAYSDALKVPRQTHFHKTSGDELCRQRSSHLQSISSEADELKSLPSIYSRSSQVYFSNLCMVQSDHQELYYEIKPHNGMKILPSENALVEAAHAFGDEDRLSLCSDIELPCGGESNKHTASISSSQKWSPAGKKNFSMQRLQGDFDASKIRKVTHREIDNVMGLSNNVPSNARQRCYLGKGESGYSLYDNKSKNSSIHVGSHLALQVLYAAYQLQLASERIHLATGSPIAEFERLLYSASPVVIPSCYQHREVGNKPVPSATHKFQNCDVLLGDVWSWYEEPGNYGLEVKTENPQNSKGVETSVVFHAYFVPFLSAVQLFGCSHHSFGGTSTGNPSNKIPEFKAKKCSFPSPHLNHPHSLAARETTILDPLISVEKCMRTCNIATSDGNDCSSVKTSALCFPDDPDVIFEFFEQDLPQQRKPLHLKVKELMEDEISDSLVFGDPSGLERTSLHDLHPASWFSVAWYPIYQIPEGRFRASFLTYHSLSHLLWRPESNSVDENAFCIVFPALGMQSYNTKGECWFHPKQPAGYLSKEGTSLDSSEILKERLRTLEETAAFFARGSVHKNNIRTTNRHPDYEFFLTRRV